MHKMQKILKAIHSNHLSDSRVQRILILSSDEHQIRNIQEQLYVHFNYDNQDYQTERNLFLFLNNKTDKLARQQRIRKYLGS